jgi:hypothetical protein
LTSRFNALGTLATNSGSVSLLEGRDFRTAGALTNSGRLTLGAGSDLLVTGNLALSGNGSVMEFELKSADGATGAEGFGQAAVTGTASLDGTLAILLAGDHNVRVGDDFTLMTAASFTGTFDSVVLPSGLSGNVSFASDQLIFHVTAAPALVLPEPSSLFGIVGVAAVVTCRRRRRVRVPV